MSLSRPITSKALKKIQQKGKYYVDNFMPKKKAHSVSTVAIRNIKDLVTDAPALTQNNMQEDFKERGIKLSQYHESLRVPV